MEVALSRWVIGQHNAVSAVRHCVFRAATGFKLNNGPVGVFLFLGLSRVGQTEVAKGLAAACFGTSDALVRFEVSQCQGQNRFSDLRAAGSDVGNEQGTLIETLRRHPSCLVVLDGIDQANPYFFEAFVSVIDSGRLTDNMGYSVDCSQAVFVLTSTFCTAETLASTDLLAIARGFLPSVVINRLSGSMIWLESTSGKDS